MTSATLDGHPLSAHLFDTEDEFDPEGYVDGPSSDSLVQKVAVSLIVFLPFAGFVAALVFAGASGIRAVDILTAAVLYVVSGLGVTVGYHRLLTHRSFVAKRPLRIALAIAGSFAIEGSPLSWVALHRRHHVYSDRPGDPHSPNLSGGRPAERLRGFVHAHTGWLYTAEQADVERWAPDLLADPDLRWIARLVPVWTVLSVGLPALVGFCATGSGSGAVECLLWAGLARVFLLHHVTWSTNSLCHMFGRRPFRSRDQSRNFAPLALLSFGEAWHNGHHAFPSSARHGLGPGEPDISARVIAILERLRLVSNVRVPDETRLASRRR